MGWVQMSKRDLQRIEVLAEIQAGQSAMGRSSGHHPSTDTHILRGAECRRKVVTQPLQGTIAWYAWRSAGPVKLCVGLRWGGRAGAPDIRMPKAGDFDYSSQARQTLRKGV